MKISIMDVANELEILSHQPAWHLVYWIYITGRREWKAILLWKTYTKYLMYQLTIARIVTGIPNTDTVRKQKHLFWRIFSV